MDLASPRRGIFISSEYENYLILKSVLILKNQKIDLEYVLKIQSNFFNFKVTAYILEIKILEYWTLKMNQGIKWFLIMTNWYNILNVSNLSWIVFDLK